MAAPSLSAFATGATDAGGAWSYSTGTMSPALSAGQVVILHVLQDGTSGSVTLDSITSSNEIESLDGTDGTMDYIGAFSGGSLIQYLWIGRVTASISGSVTFNGSNSGTDDLYLWAYSFNDVNTGTTLASVLEQNGTTTPSESSGTSADIADAGVTTTGPDRLALNVVGVNDDNAVGSFTGETGGNWDASFGYASATGTDGSMQLETATLASAGTIDGGSYTMAASDGWGVVGFALIGTTAATAYAPPPTAHLRKIHHLLRR